jgi:dephospho-CoA kinase
MIVLGLTGSIGMGKTTAANFFREFGAAVFDADQCVHELYDGPAAIKLEEAFPGVTREGSVDRATLGARVFGDRNALARLEAIVHPMVWQRRKAFYENVRSRGIRLVVLDLPLLFETKAENQVDAIAVVVAPDALQRERVLARAGMTEQKFLSIKSRQTPSREKCRRAHFIISTDCGLDVERRQIGLIVSALSALESRPASQF